MPSSFAIPILAMGTALVAYPATKNYAVNDSYSQAKESLEIQQRDISIVDVQDTDHQITADPDGLYYVKASSNDQQVRFIVDSGANTTIVTQADARRLGIDPKTLHYREKLVTANGSAPLAFVHLPSLTVAGKTYSHVQVAVFGRQGGVSLLGQDMIRRFRRFAMEDGVMTLA